MTFMQLSLEETCRGMKVGKLRGVAEGIGTQGVQLTGRFSLRRTQTPGSTKRKIDECPAKRGQRGAI